MESENAPARIFIVEDHEIMRQMLREYLEIEPDLTVCDSASTAAEALEKVPDAAPDLVLVDVALPDVNGIELVQRLRERDPGLVIAMLSGHGERSYVDQAFEAGARGYILKGQSEELANALHQVLRGEEYLSPAFEG